MIIVSSCLAGLCSNYKQGACPRPRIAELVEQGKAIPVCPEQLGGLPTPREPAEIIGSGAGDCVLDGRARVMTRDGRDVTGNYLRGAAETLKLAQMTGASLVILNERSPSCGVKAVYDGTFSHRAIPGCGVTTALFVRNGFQVVSDEDFT
ncbi:MAG: DUF523 domain-containing protein [bacterium]|nr:DUF523 domain-containing protein [Candidatus Sumerlaeota bacterium]